MKRLTTMLILAPYVLLVATLPAAQPPEEFVEAGEARRREIPLGGDFRPDPQTPVFVAVGHGARILLSRDDGKTWKQVFWGYPGSDHGGWATNSVAYTGGVFAVPVGWTKPTSYLASEDGVHWRHLTAGTSRPVKADDPGLMPTTMSLAGGQGVFVGSGYMTITATPDFGKTWSTFSLRSFKDDPHGRRLATHHVKTIYCGDESGRFLAVGDDRSPEHPRFGNLFASDDLGKTWKWLEPRELDKAEGKTGLVANGKIVLLVDKAGENVFRSLDAGESWEGPFATGTGRVTPSVVGGEFWLAGAKSRASADGKVWRDLPEAVPAGQVAASDRGTLISIDRRRYNILRSADGGRTWNEVYAFEPESEHVHGTQGLRDIAFGYTTAKPLDR